ncbi:MAG: ATP-binding domain-containing protein [Bifidobacteriaceae bacterium]|jgi:superfamily I DNA/RNA helicase|nr:ATP-binding domain-containing protein [Bifidobacteriaceae bacterium]
MEDCQTDTVKAVETLCQIAELPSPRGLKVQLKKVRGVWERWQPHLSSATSTGDADAIRWTRIRAVKGAEFEAVVVALPSKARGGRHVLDDWQNGENTEARRVLYVGVSRAKKLVVLVVSPSGEEQLTSILQSRGVPFEITQTGGAR